MYFGTWRVLAIPLAVVVIFVALYAIWLLLDLPPEETLTRVAKDFFRRFGALTVFVAAVIEALVLIGWYFPGTLVIVLALVLAEGDLARLVEGAVLAIAGLVVGYVANFLLGKYGWYTLLVAVGMGPSLEKAARRLHVHGLTVIFATYWQPNLASLISTSAGILRLPFGRFVVYSLAASTVWIGFWAALIYSVGPSAMALVGPQFIALALAVWIGLRLLLSWREARRMRAPTTTASKDRE
jgi:membrane-associated protein